MANRRLLSGILILVFCISACSSINPDENLEGEISAAPSSERSQPLSVWLPLYLPKEFSGSFLGDEDIILAANENSAAVKIDVGSDALVSRWVYVLAAPFSTLTDEISSLDLITFWQGGDVNDFPIDTLFLDGKTKALFEKLWGFASVARVNVVGEEELISTAWNTPKAWALIPFETLEPRWKGIRVDGQSPVRKRFDALNYPLSVPLSAVGPQVEVQIFLDKIRSAETQLLLPTNRDESKLATVLLTGVTALVRATAYLMETNGMSYPAIDIGDVLRGADILHISNEIPFTDTCPKPFYNRTNESNLVFCSKPEYIQLLEAIGTDVVELTGDHFRDWGPDAMLNTVAMYEDRGWQYYGGGKNLEDALQPALFDINGNKIAFLGCNAKPPGYATVTADYPGALHCDMEAMAKSIDAVVKKGYLPIFTFQHIEYYSYSINTNLVNDFHKAAEAGALVISGSQAHQPHAFEFYKGSLLHYGLGNLFFDQYDESAAQRQAFMDMHIFYNGRYISTELITIQFVDNARSRFSTDDERAELLETVFSASAW